MSEQATTVHPPEGIIYGDESALEQKLGDFIMAGATGLHIIYDFDRTLTVRKPDVDDDITTWNILRDHLPPTAQAEYKALYDKYRALEIAETMTEADAAEWWTAILDLFVQNRINLQEVEADFLHRASVRPDTQELFSMCDANAIPTVIMSAGIRDVIDVWGKAYGIKPTLTIATALRLDEAGNIVGWEEDTLVHALNKHEADHQELVTIRQNRPKAIIVGDGMGDADMAIGDQDVLRIRVYDPREDDVTDLERVRARTFERFDAMIESGSFEPLRQLVQMIVDGQSAVSEPFDSSPK